MQNSQAWRPSKFVLGKNGYEASQNLDEVHLGSRFIVNLQARVCEKLIKEHAFGRLLDLGCGKVPLYEVYKNYISDNVCVDWPQTLHKSSHLDYEMNLNNEIPLPSEHFDTILATDVLEHITNPDLLWKEIARLLRQKGKIIIPSVRNSGATLNPLSSGLFFVQKSPTF